MSDTSQGPGWWIASDGKWYPPESAPAPAPPPPAPPGVPPTPEPSVEEGKPSRPWWQKWWVIAIAVVVVGVILAGIFASPEDTEDADDAVEVAAEPTEAAAEEPTAEPTEAPAEEPTETPAEEPTAEPTEAPVEEPTETPAEEPTAEPTEPTAVPDDGCRYLGVDSFGDMQVEMTATSPFDEMTDLAIDYALADGDGVRFATSFTSVEDVRPGETVQIPTDSLESLPGDVDESQIDCSILSIEDFGFGSPTAAAPSDSCEYVGVDNFDDMQVRIDVVSPFDDVADLIITIGVYNSDGIRFATPVEFIDLVEPGEAIRADVDTLDSIPSGVEPDGISCEVLSFDQF